MLQLDAILYASTLPDGTYIGAFPVSLNILELPCGGTVGKTIILVRLEHSWNASLPILVTFSGIMMLVRLEQPKNADPPILDILSGIEILVRLEQP